MVDLDLATRLAVEGRLTYGEIAQRINWPESRSLESLIRILERRLPAPRRVRSLDDVRPQTKCRQVR